MEEDRLNFYQCLVAVGTCLIVIAVSALYLWQKSIFWEAIAWQLLLLIFLVALTAPWFHREQATLNRLSFWILLLLIYIMSWRLPVDVFFIYTIIWIACAPGYLSHKWCWFWLNMVNVGWYLVRNFSWGHNQALAESLLVLTFHVFALLSAIIALKSSDANAETQLLNRELQAAQHLLSETSRERERTRIARDLHDLLGHHLTALTINLQVAGRLSEGEAKEKIEQCHSLSKLLLSDVREAVATLRDMPIVNLRELLEIAVGEIPRLQITLEFEDELQVDNVNAAEVLLRLVQESITNTLKHTSAREALIRVYQRDDQIILEYCDTGGGCDSLVSGHGLTGMRERLERIGGELQIQSTPNMSLRARTPLVS